MYVMDKQIKILLVDDDTFLSAIYAEKFESQDFVVLQAINGEEGLKMAKKDMPDIILLDLLMPKMDGFECLEKIKSDIELRDIPVIIHSNLGGRDDIERCMHLGASAYLIKSHTLPHEAVNKVKAVLHIE